MGVQSLNYDWKVLKRMLTSAYNEFGRIFPGHIMGAFYPEKFDYNTRHSRASRFLRDHHEELGLKEFPTWTGITFVYATAKKYVKDVLPKEKKKINM